MPHPLDSFFAPDSIALIGASRDHDKIPGRLLAMLRKNEFPGKLYPINPNYDDIDGLKCYKSVADVGAPIDLAVIIIPRMQTPLRRERLRLLGAVFLELCEMRSRAREIQAAIAIGNLCS
jgi:acyl-CoA synthetase (NDP forming)